MPYELRPADVKGLPAYHRVLTSAFANGGLRTYVYPNGQTKESLNFVFNRNLGLLSKPPSSGSFIVCAYDTSAPAPDSDFEYPEGFEVPPECEMSAEERKERKRAVGFAWYIVEANPKTAEEIEKANEKKPTPPGANAALLDAFSESLKQARVKYLPNLAHVNLNTLGTEMEVWGKGVGSMLLRWGIELAEEKNLPVWLEATKAGRPLYLKHGFEELGLIEGFDTRDFGAPEEMPYWCMIRPLGKKVDEKVKISQPLPDEKTEGIVAATAETKVAVA